MGSRFLVTGKGVEKWKIGMVERWDLTLSERIFGEIV